MQQKRELGVLGKLAGAATALTAILSLVFLLFPRLKPSTDTASPHLPAEALSPDAAEVIRHVLKANEVAEAVAEFAFKPLDVDPPAPEASPEEQVAYLVALMKYFQEAESRSRKHVAALEEVKLAVTPAAFQLAYQAQLAAWREQVQLFSRASILATRAILDVRSRGSAAYLEFFTELGELGAQSAEIDNALNQASADVRAAALAVGIE